jgi:hypothetical protein
MSLRVEVDADVAIVLFEMLASRNSLAEQLNLEVPERNSLWALESALEKQLVASLQTDYAAQLDTARQSVAARLG